MCDSTSILFTEVPDEILPVIGDMFKMDDVQQFHFSFSSYQPEARRFEE
jgi:hypothetical protein